MGIEQVGIDWVPDACTLPTVDQPLRVAEFDAVFAESVRQVERLAPAQVRLRLDPTGMVAAKVADLAVRETGCCSFFTFTQTSNAGQLWLDITVPAAQVEVLDALAARVAALSDRSAA